MVLGSLEGGEQSRLDVAPCSSIERLLLSPDDVGVRELIDVRGKEVVGEGRDLLDSADDDVAELSVLALLGQGLVDLTCGSDSKIEALHVRTEGEMMGDEASDVRSWGRTRADDDSLDFFVRSEVFGNLRDEPLEGGFPDHFRQVRSGVGMSEKVFGEEKNELIPVDQARRVHLSVQSLSNKGGS